jgi:hypothetical protein
VSLLHPKYALPGLGLAKVCHHWSRDQFVRIPEIVW